MSQQDYVERDEIDISLLEENEDNPNQMSSREFDLLVDNVQRTGLTEAVVVRPLDNGRYRIVSGHHRYKAALYLDYEKVPVAIITDPNFDDEAELFQLVRMNAIKGKLDPQKFIQTYQKVAGKYGDEILQDMFGFADQAMFQKLITQTAKGLPPEIKDKFKEAAKEVKTIDGLASLLNTLFTKYGDTVPYGYMVFEQGKQKHMWIRIDAKTMKALYLIGDLCIEQNVTMDDVIGGVVKSIAQGDLPDLITDIVENAPKVVIPTGLAVTPTKDHIAAAKSVK